MIADLFEQLPGRERELIAIQMQKERLDLLRLDLDRLNERNREILLLWEQGYSARHIATAMGFPSATAANTGSYNCFEKLKALVMARKLIHERKL
jgi:DNA-directed RNA polymerase specialized sigma24 family protein